jgi:hypothetical protein
MISHEKTPLSVSRKIIAGFMFMMPAFLNTPDTVASSPTEAPVEVSQETKAALSELCLAIYFDSDGSQCNPSIPSQRPETADLDLVEFTAGMQELSERLRFDQ